MSLNTDEPSVLDLARYERWIGRRLPPPKLSEVRAGALTAMIDGGDLRYVRLGETELVRRIFGGVRDKNWNTIGGALEDLRLEANADFFNLTFSSHHSSGGVDFRWRSTVTGSSDGVIRYQMDGHALRAFRYCRIGLCVLHPSVEFAGRPYTARTMEGETSGVLPELIGPQRVEKGLELPLFSPFDALTFDLGGGIEVVHEFEGELFETEDQRNWTDASFKTYAMPLAMGYPHDTAAGQRFRQVVTIKVRAPASRPAPRRSCAPILLTLGNGLGRSLPPLGASIASEGEPLSSREVDLLRELDLAHLRVDLDLSDPGWTGLLERSVGEASSLRCGLELALFLSDNGASELDCFASALPPDARVERILLYHMSEAVTPQALVHLARERLGERISLGGGTNIYFAQLNASRPSCRCLDVLTYPITPQVHAFDEASLVETLVAQAATVATARSFAGKCDIVVSPVTLRPRFNPDATEPEPPRPGDLPTSVDPRQMSLFGAAWTLGSVKHLAESGVAAATYYETVGWRGMIEREGGPSAPTLFRSRPCMAFPLYHVFADLAGWHGAEVFAAYSTDPLAVEGLALRRGVDELLLVASLSPRPLSVSLVSLRPAETVTIRTLDDESLDMAALKPSAFQAATQEIVLRSDNLTIELAPYAVVRVGFRRCTR